MKHMLDWLCASLCQHLSRIFGLLSRPQSGLLLYTDRPTEKWSISETVFQLLTLNFAVAILCQNITIFQQQHMSIFLAKVKISNFNRYNSVHKSFGVFHMSPSHPWTLSCVEFLRSSLFYGMVLQYLANSNILIWHFITNTASVILILCIVYSFFILLFRQPTFLHSVCCFCSADVTYTLKKPNGRNVLVLKKHYNVWLSVFLWYLRRTLDKLFRFLPSSRHNSWKYFKDKRLWKLRLRACHHIILPLPYGAIFPHFQCF